MKMVSLGLFILLSAALSCKSPQNKSDPVEPVQPIADPPPIVKPGHDWKPDITPDPIVPPVTVIKDPDEASPANSLTFGRELKKGEAIQSNDGRFRLFFQNDANLVLMYKNQTLWGTDTWESEGERVVFGNDGNLMVLTHSKKVLWSSGTGGKDAKLVRLNNDGSLNIYDSNNKVIWTNNICCYPPGKPSDTKANIAGRWSEKGNWPLIPLHVLMMPDGKVLSFGTDDKGVQKAYTYDVWDPSLGLVNHAHKTLPNKQNTDTFCSAPTLAAASGNVIIPGGDTRNPPNKGIKNTLIFDSKKQTMSRGPDLANARWYTTSTTLPNGDIIVVGGSSDTRNAVTVPEIYSVKNNSWRTLMGAANGQIINDHEGKWFYPRQWVGPDGRIFGMTGDAMYWLSTSGDGSMQRVGKNLPNRSRSYTSAAVMYQPGKIVQMGGSVRGNVGSRASDGTITVDINGHEPVVTSEAPMANSRHWVSATVLPSGEVLATGGSAVENQLREPGFTAELWNPETKTFRPLNATKIARLYHSTSLLLQDGSVLIGGGGAPGPVTNLNAEIFYPPYLFDESEKFAARPIINSAPARVNYGHTAEVSTAGGEIKKIALIKLGAVTHSNDMEQRFIPLNFTTAGNKLRVQFPGSPNLAPPGYYHLFVLNAQGVPSISKIVHIPPPS